MGNVHNPRSQLSVLVKDLKTKQRKWYKVTARCYNPQGQLTGVFVEPELDPAITRHVYGFTYQNRDYPGCLACKRLHTMGSWFELEPITLIQTNQKIIVTANPNQIPWWKKFKKTLSKALLKFAWKNLNYLYRIHQATYRKLSKI